MHTPTAFPFHLHWNAQDIADAVPLRLHQLYDIDHVGETALQASANQVGPQRRPRSTSYLPGSHLPALIRIR
jgi:hypothetical protein